MAFLPEPGAEPIPGYRLVERLGTGGYGEVWKVTAPGGLTKAIKLVYGHMKDARAEQELKSLCRIKEVRHPFLLSLERFEIVDTQLFIVTELADKSLQDRFEECVRAGLRGILRGELLVYMRDACDALDYMADHYGLQHLDIKPQNLLLVGGRIKIADFGLVKDLQGGSATATGGVTPIYATPEAFDGRVSKYSDQYSLAIVYQEMLTGCRPFPGITSLQLAAQHTSSPPMLDSLPASDRAIIARALAKSPEQRFPTCSALVDSLFQAGAVDSAWHSVRAQPTSLAPQVDVETSIPSAKREPTPTTDEQEILSRATQTSPRASPKPLPAEEENLAGSPIPFLPTREGTLRPTLIIGMGRIACWTLRRLKQRLQRRFGSLSSVPILRLLLIDTDRSTIREAQNGEPDQTLDAGEMLLLPLCPPEHYRDQARSLLRWLDRRWLYNIPRSLQTEGARPLGRLALVDNGAEVLSRLREMLAVAASPEAKSTTEKLTGFAVHAENPRIFLVASIAGATGGGMVLDLAFAVRQILAEFHLSPEHLYGVLVHATSQRPAEVQLARLNACAALYELQHYNRADSPYPGDPEHDFSAFGPEVRPFQACYLVHLGDRLGDVEAEAATDPLAEYLFISAATGMGSFFDQWRLSLCAASDSQPEDTGLRTFGLYRYSVAQHELAKLAAELFCKGIVDRWCGRPSRAGDNLPEQGVSIHLSTLGLDAAGLSNRFNGVVRDLLGDDPEEYFPKLLSDLLVKQTSAPGATASAALAEQALGKIETVLGRGADTLESRVPGGRTPLEVALGKHATGLCDDLGRATGTWLIGLVEQPACRLTAAHQAARALAEHLANSIAVTKSKLAGVRSLRKELRARLVSGELAKDGGSRFTLKGARRQAKTDTLVQKLDEYVQLRLREIVLEGLLQVFPAVASSVSDSAQNLVHARQKLRYFRETLSQGLGLPRGPEETPAPLPCTTDLLPFGSRNLAEAAKKLFQHIEPELSLRFDRTFQDQVLNQHGGLWGFLTGKQDMTEWVKRELQHRALASLLHATSDLDAAKLFLESRKDTEEGKLELLNHVAAVAPNLDISSHWQHRVVALPNSQAGALVRDMLSQALTDVPSTVLHSEGDIVFCHEAAGLPIRQMAELLLGDETTYVDAALQVMTRVDVAWSPLACSAEK